MAYTPPEQQKLCFVNPTFSNEDKPTEAVTVKSDPSDFDHAPQIKDQPRKKSRSKRRCCLVACGISLLVILVAVGMVLFMYLREEPSPALDAGITKLNLTQAEMIALFGNSTLEDTNVSTVSPFSNDGGVGESPQGEQQEVCATNNPVLKIVAKECKGGTTHLWVHNSGDTFRKDYGMFKSGAYLTKSVSECPASKTVSFLVTVPPGVYAIMVLNDKDRDSRMDKNWLGIPTEGVGASRGAKGGPFGGPKWNDAKITCVCDEALQIDVDLWSK